MKLKLNNVARISSADIFIDGITVIVGPNAAGKSTINRAAMTLCSVSSKLPTLVQSERLSSVFNVVRESFNKFGGDLFPTDKWFNKSQGLYSLWLSGDWWENLSGAHNWFRESLKGQFEVSVYPESFCNSTKMIDALLEAKSRVLEIVHRNDCAYVKHVCEKAFEKAFKGQMRPVYANQPTESHISIGKENYTVEIAFKDGELSNLAEMGRAIVPSTIYFEPLNYTDFVGRNSFRPSDRYTAGDQCACNVISKPIPKELSLEEDEELKETREILKEIIQTIHGSLVDDEGLVKFKENINNTDYLINLKNIASGMKTMAAIVRAIENRSIRRGSLLIIDEPESNLHPEWQVKFAIFLVLLQYRLGIYILLNTHSPYFLQAINRYSKDSEIPCHFYNMVADHVNPSIDDNIVKSPISYHTESVEDNLESIFRDMVRPFDNLI